MMIILLFSRRKVEEREIRRDWIKEKKRKKKKEKGRD